MAFTGSPYGRPVTPVSSTTGLPLVAGGAGPFYGDPVILLDGSGNVITSFPATSVSQGGGSVVANANGSIAITAPAGPAASAGLGVTITTGAGTPGGNHPGGNLTIALGLGTGTALNGLMQLTSGTILVGAAADATSDNGLDIEYTFPSTTGNIKNHGVFVVMNTPTTTTGEILGFRAAITGANGSYTSAIMANYVCGPLTPGTGQIVQNIVHYASDPPVAPTGDGTGAATGVSTNWSTTVLTNYSSWFGVRVRPPLTTTTVPNVVGFQLDTIPAGALGSTSTVGLLVGVAAGTGVSVMQLTGNNATHIGNAFAGGAPLMTMTPANHTACTTEITTWNVQGNTLAFTGSPASQRFNIFGQPTVSAGSAQTLSVLTTLNIAGAPTMSGVNMVATTTSALNVAALGPTINNAAGSIYSAVIVNAHTVVLNTNTQITSTDGISALRLGQITISAGSATTVNNAATLNIVGPPIAGGAGPATITNLDALRVQSGTSSFGGKFRTYNGIATLGWGVPAIYGYTRPAQQVNATVTLATYVVGASDGSFEVSANVNVTASLTVTMAVTCTYNDENNAAQTLTMAFKTGGGTVLVTSITTALGNIAYHGFPFTIRAKAGSTISIQSTGTVTSVTYTAEGRIMQVA